MLRWLCRAPVGGGRVTENPLLEAWRACYGDAPFNFYERDFDPRSIDSYKARHASSAAFSFAVPTDEALDLIASFGPVVEIGAGTGYWARLLADRGCDVVAYDLLGSAFDKWFPGGQFGNVEKGSTDKAEEHADRTLLLVWPPMSSMAADALRCYESAGGKRLIYVGEGYGGCTADDDFFAMVGDHDYCSDEPCQHGPPTWRETQTLAIPQWDGIHDYLGVYERSGLGAPERAGRASA